jgi:N-acetylglucosamine-6-sulfatase
MLFAAANLMVAATASTLKQPNIVFVLVDDLDAHMTDLAEYMPSLQKHFVKGGTTFPKHYTSVSLCCPARVSLLTGQAAHNHNVTDVESPHGR